MSLAAGRQIYLLSFEKLKDFARLNMAEVLEDDGVVLDDFDAGTLRIALYHLLEVAAVPSIAGHCVAAAERHFLPEHGVSRYRAIFTALDGIVDKYYKAFLAISR